MNLGGNESDNTVAVPIGTALVKIVYGVVELITGIKQRFVFEVRSCAWTYP